MKRSVIIIAIIFGSLLFSIPGKTQSYNNTGRLGLPGDNFNLYGALSLFQQCQTLEEFEQKLNAEDTKINNLDLDGDGKIDYVKVIDNVSGNAHIIVLRDILNENESQDVAVIEVEKDKNNKIQIQMIGDLALYGKDYIVEPAPSGTPNPGYNTNMNNNVASGGNVYEYNYYYSNDRVGHSSDFIYAVGAWSIIHYMFAPNYVVYASPYRYGYYPTYWHPWRPMYYDDYYGHWHNHNSYSYFHQTHNYNVQTAHNYYGPRRTSSVVVHNRIERGEYKRTYDRTAAAPRGNRTNRTQNNVIRNQSTPNRIDNKRIQQQNRTPNTPATTTNPRPAVRTESRPNNTQNAAPTQRQNSNQNMNPTNRQATTPTNTTPNNRPANRQEARPTNRQESKPAIRTETKTTPRTETKQAPKSINKPVEKKQEHKESEKR